MSLEPFINSEPFTFGVELEIQVVNTHDYDPTLRAIVMCSIVVLQIVTPFLVYRSLSAIGERRE